MSSSNEVPGVVRRTAFEEPGPMADVDAALQAAVAASREAAAGPAESVPAVHVEPTVVAMGGAVWGVQASMDRRW